MRGKRLTRAGTAIAIALVALLAAQVSIAAVPAGPHLAAVELIEPVRFKDLRKEPDPSVALAIVDPATGTEKRLLEGRMDARGGVVPVPFETPSWSGDGSTIAFAAHDGRARVDRIYTLSADGTGLRALPGTADARHPVLSPNGRALAFTRSRYRSHINKDFFKDFAGEPVTVYSSATAWILDLDGAKPRRLTRWRNGLHSTPTSFSPDGTGLLMTKQDDNLDGLRVVRMSLADGATQELLRRADEAVYSPDGSRIAFTGYLNRDLVKTEESHDYLAPELYVANADGTAVRRLTRSKGVLESAPTWDPSGQRLAYVQFRADKSWLSGLANLFPTGNALMQVNADGSCRQKLFTRRSVALYGIAWQPGLGREAGPGSC